jgi:hypothetical protein
MAFQLGQFSVCLQIAGRARDLFAECGLGRAAIKGQNRRAGRPWDSRQDARARISCCDSCGRGRPPTPSVFVDRGVGVVVAPVEPVIFEGGDSIEALSL